MRYIVVRLREIILSDENNLIPNFLNKKGDTPVLATKLFLCSPPLID